MLHYISLSVCGPYDVLVLVDLPHVKKAGIHHLRGRAAHDELPFTKTKHVKTLRFAFSDTYAPPEGFLQVLTFVLDLFEAVRSVEVYNGMDLERARYLYEDVLLNLFASLGPSLEPHLDTLETPLLPGKFNQNGIWYALIPNLSTFHRLEALKIPEQLFNQHVRNVINGEAVTPESTEGPMYLLPSLKLGFLPPTLGSPILDRCKLSTVILRHLWSTRTCFPSFVLWTCSLIV
ncbi:hypothetical protein PSPO01_06553 [Paraphaeosphaeria sporulosa]